MLAGVPSPVQRLDILQHRLVGVQHSLSCEQLESLASATHGFVGADLAALCNEAALSALRRYISLKKSSQQLGYYDNNAEKPDIREINDPLGYQVNSIASSLSKLTMSVDDVLCTSRSNDTENNGSSGKKDDLLLLVTTEDFEKAKIKVRPSAMREVSYSPSRSTQFSLMTISSIIICYFSFLITVCCLSNVVVLSHLFFSFYLFVSIFSFMNSNLV